MPRDSESLVLAVIANQHAMPITEILRLIISLWVMVQSLDQRYASENRIEGRSHNGNDAEVSVAGRDTPSNRQMCSSDETPGPSWRGCGMFSSGQDIDNGTRLALGGPTNLAPIYAVTFVRLVASGRCRSIHRQFRCRILVTVRPT